MLRRRPLAILILVSVLVPVLWFFTDTRLGGVAAGFDRDASGRLEPDEVGPVLDRRFAQADRDASGALDGIEVRRWLMSQWLSGRTGRVDPPPLPERPDADDLRAWLRAPVAEGELDGVGLLVLVDGEVVFRHVEGDVAADTALPLASASKWPAAAVFACLDDRGELNLEVPVATLVDEVPRSWARASLAQMLSHTAGAPAEHALDFDAATTLATAGRRLTGGLPSAAPGDMFRYGGVSMQVAGWVAETATRRSWRRLFVECLAWPLSLDSASWGHPLIGPAASGFASLGGGLWMSLDDYGSFLSMLQQRGRFGGVVNLHAAALERMARDRVGRMPREALPPAADPAWGYALGAWCERVDAQGVCTSRSSAGALGSYPWLDSERGVAGMLIMVDSLPRVMAWNLATRKLVEQIYGRAVISGAMNRPPGE